MKQNISVIACGISVTLSLPMPLQGYMLLLLLSLFKELIFTSFTEE